MNMTVEEYLANGGQITHIPPTPIQKIDMRKDKVILLDVLRTQGAKQVDELVALLQGQKKNLKNAIDAIRRKGIPIIQKDGWVALDQGDLPTRNIEVQDQRKQPIYLDEQQISFAIGKYYLNSKHLVAVNNTYWTGYECDIFAITKGLKPIEFEIKTSRADFLKDAQKAKWQRPISVWKHYYIMPHHIYSPDMVNLLPHPNSGILLLSQQDGYIYISECRKATAHKVKPINTKQMMEISRLISMRLWQGKKNG